MNKKYVFLAAILVVIIAYGLSNLSGETSNIKNVSLSNSQNFMVDVKLPALNTLEKVGEQSFNKYCANCHGLGGAGKKNVAPPLIHKIYEPNHHADIAFQFAAQRGVRAHHWPFGNMPPVKDITLLEIKNITNYIRVIQRANGIN